MAREKARSGSITTFFSYKGGVGRTMALANVGFLSAMAGKRVLLMDWDLEAPGLAYYFRGLTDHADSGSIRKADGVLDLFWAWTRGIRGAETRSALETHVRRFRAGSLFETCTRPLIASKHLPKNGRLDFIGAGSPMIEAPDLVPYADALARFNWTEFFEESAGGLMIEALRDWCREKYDVILVDSRTGLADVAGVCTMQLPDAVVLCFVLNRQNIEGIAQVAAAMRGARGDEIVARICPMRVSQDRPTEEADARARAHRHLQRAGIEPAAIEADMERIAIPVAANVPFYETLAPFAANDPAHDVLTLAYQTLTEAVTGVELYRPKIDPAWREEVRRRLEPKLTTVDYLESLQNAEPIRAREEIERYVLGALDADPALELDRDYVEALVAAAFSLAETTWNNDDPEGLTEAEAEVVVRQAIELLRRLHTTNEGDWRLPLVGALEDLQLYFPASSDLHLYSVFEDILSIGEQNFDILQRRVRHALNEARRVLTGRPAHALQMTEKALHLLDAMRELPEAKASIISLIDGEIGDVRSAAMMKRNRAAAKREARRALEVLADVPGELTAISLIASLHLRLARLEGPGAAGKRHILEAVRTFPRIVLNDIDTYNFAADMVLEGTDTASAALSFVTSVFGVNQRRSLPRGAMRSPFPFMRTSQEAIHYADITDRLASAIGETRRASADKALAALAEVSGSVLARFIRRPSSRRAKGSIVSLAKSYTHLFETLAAAGASKASLETLGDSLRNLAHIHSEDS